MNGEYVVHVTNGGIDSQPVLVSDYLASHQNAVQVGNMIFPVGLIVFGVFLVLVLIGLKKSIFMVQQQTVKIVQRLGKFKEVATAGINFKIPFVDSVVKEMSLQVEQLEENVVAKSKDNSFLTIPVKVQFQVLAEKAQDAFYQLSNAGEQMRAYITNVIRSEATTMTMEEIFQSKDVFQKASQEALDEKFSGFGFKIVNVLVDNPLPSEDVVNAFNKVISSQRLKEAAVNEAEAIRIKTVAVANAEGESLTIKAKAYVEQREIIVKGMAGIIPDDMMPGYLVGIDWRNTVAEASKGPGNMIIVPQGAETLGTLIGSLKEHKSTVDA